MFDLENKYIGAVAILVLVLAFGAGMKYGASKLGEKPEGIVIEEPPPVAAGEEERETIQVYVIGAVANPGVYRLPASGKVWAI